MKKLWIGLIIAARVAGCRNGPNNAADTAGGFGSGGTAGGNYAPPPAVPITADTSLRDTTLRDTSLRDSVKANKHGKRY